VKEWWQAFGMGYFAGFWTCLTIVAVLASCAPVQRQAGEDAGYLGGPTMACQARVGADGQVGC
jgi:hypothetical protein